MICQTALAFGAGNLAILGSHLRRCHASSCDINDDRHSSETLTLAAASAAITARHNKATRASLTVEHPPSRSAGADLAKRKKKSSSFTTTGQSGRCCFASRQAPRPWGTGPAWRAAASTRQIRSGSATACELRGVILPARQHQLGWWDMQGRRE